VLEHGGRLRAAAAHWGIPLAQWLDLSTGIAPWSYPVPPLPAEVWQRLPEDDDGLEAAAQAYYGSERLLMLPGSQAAIQWLPRLARSEGVAIIAPGYGEYAAAATAAGCAVRPFGANELDAACATARLVIVANPNNPDGVCFSRQALLAAAAKLHKRHGWLVVDEAFIDAEPAESLAGLAGGGAAANVIVLRSLGKFFGLAGARVGCAIAAPALLDKLHEAIGPWALSHPARWVARHALADTAWQAEQRERLRGAALRLDALLQKVMRSGIPGDGLGETAGTTLFRYLTTPRATEIHAALAQRGVLLRHFDDPSALRFGLPGDENQWQRLADTLKEIS